MDKKELLDIVSRYDYEAFEDLSDQEWLTLTNKWDIDIVKAILWQIADSNIGEFDADIIIDLQARTLESIDSAYNSMCRNNKPFGNDMREWDITELQLQVRAGKFTHSNSYFPTKDDGNPDYAILQRMLDDYHSAYRQMSTTMAKIRDKAKEDTNLLALLNTQDKEVARLKKELERYKGVEEELRFEIEQLKMEKKELSQMSQKLVQKTEHEDLLKTLRGYMNIARRKNAKKRGYIKMVILEMAQSARLTLPEDMLQELDKFDDENLDRAANMTFNAPIGQVVAHADNITNNKGKN